MKKNIKMNIRKISVLFLAACLLTGNGSVLAAEDSGAASESMGTVEGNNYGLIVDLVPENNTTNYCITSGSEEEPRRGTSDTPYDPLIVTADSITVENNTEGEPYVLVPGLVVNNTSSEGSLQIAVDGAVTVTDESTTNSDACAIKVNTQEGQTDIKTGDAAATAVSLNEQEAASASATGLYIEESVNTEQNDEGSVTINAANVSATASSNSSDSSYAVAAAINVWKNTNGNTTINVQNAAASATAVTSSPEDTSAARATAIHASSEDGGHTSVTAQEASATVTVSASRDEAILAIIEGQGFAAALEATADDSYTTVNVGKLYAEGDGAIAMGAYLTNHSQTEGSADAPKQGITAELGDVTVLSKNFENDSVLLPFISLIYPFVYTAGMNLDSHGGTLNVTAGNVDVTADNKAIGLYARANKADSGPGTVAGSIYAQTKDIDVKGEGSTGMVLQGEALKDQDAKATSTIDIVADGTVSADDVAIKVLTASPSPAFESLGQEPPAELETTYDTNNINITVWAAKENKDGEIIRAVSTAVSMEGAVGRIPVVSEVVDKDVSAAMESRINYIVKVADAWAGKMSVTSTDKKNSITIGQKDYFTANEGEQVTFCITLNKAEEKLEGVYYNNEDDTTLTLLGNLVKDDNGNYVFTMKRGGAMRLGLKVHTHKPYTAAPENVVAATCTSEGSYDSVVKCAKCGEELSRTKVITDKLEHIAGTPSKENTSATEYDLVTRCTMCNTILSTQHMTFSPDNPNPPAPVNPEQENTDPSNTDNTDSSNTNKPAYSKPSRPASAQQTRTAYLQYVTVDPQTTVYGVKSADHPPMAEAAETIGKYLDNNNASLIIKYVDSILDEEEMDRFNRLSAEDKILVLLTILNFGNEKPGKSDRKEAYTIPGILLTNYTNRVEKMKDAEKKELEKKIKDLFMLPPANYRGAATDFLVLEFEVTINGQQEFVKYTFYKDNGLSFDSKSGAFAAHSVPSTQNNGEWKLYQIEIGIYVYA